MNGKRRAVDSFPRLIHSPEPLRGAGPLTPLLVEPDVTDVLVNGVVVLRNGEHTGARPGQVVRGPGWTGWRAAAH